MPTELACFWRKKFEIIFKPVRLNVFYRVDSEGKVNILGGDIFGKKKKKNIWPPVSLGIVTETELLEIKSIVNCY
jgi:hypothetical protein